MKLNNIISINMSTNKIIEILGDQSDFLLNHTCKTIDKTKDKINDNAGGADCRKGICPQCFTDDHRVSKCIKELKQITQNYGNCEF